MQFRSTDCIRDDIIYGDMGSEEYLMNRKNMGILYFTVLFSAFVFFTSCSTDNSYMPEFAFDSDNHYTGFDERIDIETPKISSEQGYVVVSDREISGNLKTWKKFVSDSEKGRDTSVRLVVYLDNSQPHICDIFHHEGKYYIFNNIDEEVYKDGYNYLLTLEGRFGMPEKDQKAVILTNNNGITFDIYMNSWLSSNYQASQSIQPTRLVMFLKGDE